MNSRNYSFLKTLTCIWLSCTCKDLPCHTWYHIHNLDTDWLLGKYSESKSGFFTRLKCGLKLLKNPSCFITGASLGFPNHGSTCIRSQKIVGAWHPRNPWYVRRPLMNKSQNIVGASALDLIKLWVPGTHVNRPRHKPNYNITFNTKYKCCL